MFEFLARARRDLISKIIVATGGIMLVGTMVLVYLSIGFVHDHTFSERVRTADLMSGMVKLGLHDAMLRNARTEIDGNIQRVAESQHVNSIRIYNKDGEVKFSNAPSEEGTIIGREHEACRICHHQDPPKVDLTLEERASRFHLPDGGHFFRVVTPIGNPTECAAGPCHFHPQDAQVLGALELVFSFDDTDAVVAGYRSRLVMTGTIFFIITSGCIFMGLRQIITQPLNKLTKTSEDIASGLTPQHNTEITTRRDQLGKLARSQEGMVRALHAQQEILNERMKEYELLFDNVPCVVTVQDRDYKLLEYNKESRVRFNPFPGAYCYQAYKGVNEKCEACPVERTFETGLAHCSEEYRQNPDGTYSHWIVHTAPILDADGKVTKAMEMCLDITERKKLEERLKESEKKYHTIFNNAPNSMFVLDSTDLTILDCNTTANAVYGWAAGELEGRSFLSVIHPDEMEGVASQMRAFTFIKQVKCVRKHGEPFFVDMMLASSGHLDQQHLLVSTTDITERLESEQQLFHAGKMATLGEMATGVAHELNQPLTVIKAASNYFMKKVRAGEAIPEETMATLASEVDSYVDRATRIINHMREFGRQVDQEPEPVNVNDAASRAYSLLGKQFEARGILVEWDLAQTIPLVMATPDQLEQVIINLLVNARDALEEKMEAGEASRMRIAVRTFEAQGKVVVQVEDTGGGIPDDLMHKIFEPFYTTKKVGKGTGLGLSISYGLIKDFGGDIHAANGPDGAVFTIILPVAEA